MNIKIDLYNFFVKEARRSLIPAQKRMIENRRGVRNDDPPHNAPLTIKAKGFDHWLKATGETKSKAFLYTAAKTRLVLFASESHHSGRYMYKGTIKSPGQRKNEPPTYERLIAWHTDEYSGLYEQLPVGSQFPKRMVTEIFNQINPQLAKTFTRKWRVVL